MSKARHTPAAACPRHESRRRGGGVNPVRHGAAADKGLMADIHCIDFHSVSEMSVRRLRLAVHVLLVTLKHENNLHLQSVNFS